MSRTNEGDYITIQDDQGNEKEMRVQALFMMKDETYALLAASGDTSIMRVKEDNGNQYLIHVDEEEKEDLLDAYRVIMETDPDTIDHYNL